MSSATKPFSAADFDPFSTSAVTDPYAWYAALHAGPRVLHQERWDIWVLSRHEDVRGALRDHRMSSADGVTFLRAPLPMMLTQDPPDHERLRRIVGREFAPRDIHRFRPAVERFVAEGIDELVTSDDGDIVQAIAMPVPIRVMAAILGVPESDIPELRRMSNDLVQGFALEPDGSQAVEAVVNTFDLTLITTAIVDIHGYFTKLIADRRRAPTDDLITKLMYPPSGEELDEQELLWFCLLLLVAGIETTTNLIGNMTIAFLDHPGQWTLLREHPELIGAAVNEALRYDAPIQGFFRTVTAAYPIGETTIPAGARALVAFGAANRDPAHYADPDDFRIERNPTDHMAFGAGIHRCLGAGLAELEGRIVLEQLLERTDALEQDGEIVRTTSPTLRGALRLPLDTSGWRR
jgi:beta-dihydromenaquinone-9 omega-hydroxylase